MSREEQNLEPEQDMTQKMESRNLYQPKYKVPTGNGAGCRTPGRELTFSLPPLKKSSTE